MREPKKDWLKNLHIFDLKEIETLSAARWSPHHEPGTGLYFYAADNIQRLVGAQETYILQLEDRIKSIKLAHDKLFMQLQKMRGHIEQL